MQVDFTGNLTDDPELRFTPSGVAYMRVSVAENRRYRKGGDSGEWAEETHFWNVVAWRDLAENVASSLRKGTRVVVSGRMGNRSYEADDGSKRTATEVTADEIGPSLRWATAEVTKIASGGGGRGNGGGGGGRSQAPAQSAPSQPRVAAAGEFDPYNPDDEPF